MISILVSQGLFLGTDVTHNRLLYKFQDFCVASPLPATDYMLGLALSDLAFVTPSLAVLICLFGYFHLITWSFPLAFVVMLFGWLFSSAFGFFLSMFILRSRSAYSITSLLSALLTVLPPVFYPIQLIPSSYRFLAYVVPTTDVSILVQSELGLQSYSWIQLVLSWMVLFGSTTLFFALAAYRARWRQP